MQKKLAEIAQAVGGEVVGDLDVVITGISGVKEAQPGDLTFIANSKYFSAAESTQASAVIVPLQFDPKDKTVIRVENPSLAFSRAVALCMEGVLKRPLGIDPQALVAGDAQIGKDVRIGPFTIVESKVQIGDRTVIEGGCFIGAQTVIGADCLIYPNVSIRERIILGDRVIVHGGAVIGDDGFGFDKVDGVYQKIPQVGTVVIEEDVEIGANVTIDRARFDKTVIGKGTKIDNLVQIAHNVRVGQNCVLISQSGISGSTVVEDNCILAGQVGVAGHLTIGEGTVVTSKSGVLNSLPPKSMVWGYPAKPHMQAKRVNACVQRLPELVKKIREMSQQIEDLKQKIQDLTR